MVRKTKGLRCAALVLVAVVSSGCAGRIAKHDYGKTTAELGFSGKGKVGVGVQDRRTYVVSGEKPESYAGTYRGVYGDRWNVVTAGETPLASAMTDSLASTLKSAGYQAVTLKVPPKGGAAGARPIMADGPDKSVLLVLDEWKAEISPSYMVGTGGETKLIYNATLNVLKRGKRVASATAQGQDALGSSSMNPPGHAQKAVPTAFKGILERLLKDPAVARAMK